METVSVPFVRISFIEMDIETMTKGVNALKRGTLLNEPRARADNDSKVDSFAADDLFDKIKDKPNVAVIGFTSDGDYLACSSASL